MLAVLERELLHVAPVSVLTYTLIPDMVWAVAMRLEPSEEEISDLHQVAPVTTFFIHVSPPSLLTCIPTDEDTAMIEPSEEDATDRKASEELIKLGVDETEYLSFHDDPPLTLVYNWELEITASFEPSDEEAVNMKTAAGGAVKDDRIHEVPILVLM